MRIAYPAHVKLIHGRTALTGIVTLLHACLDMKPIILGKYHYVLYFLVLAMQVSSISVPDVFIYRPDDLFDMINFDPCYKNICSRG